MADGLAELDIAEVRHALAELTEVDAALARMRAGTYGECGDCGEPIALGAPVRLPDRDALPRLPARHEKKVGGPPLTAV